MTATTTRDTCSTPCEVPFHASPLTSRERIAAAPEGASIMLFVSKRARPFET